MILPSIIMAEGNTKRRSPCLFLGGVDLSIVCPLKFGTMVRAADAFRLLSHLNHVIYPVLKRCCYSNLSHLIIYYLLLLFGITKKKRKIQHNAKFSGDTT